MEGIKLYAASLLLTIFIIAVIITVPNMPAPSLTGFVSYKNPQQATRESEKVLLFKSEGFSLGFCLKESEINGTNSTIVLSDDGFDNKTSTETVIFDTPRFIFENYTGIDLILDVEDLDDRELELVINGDKKTLIRSDENYTGTRILFIEKGDLLIGKNSLSFVNPADNKCGAVLHDIDIRASLRNIDDFKPEEKSDYIFEYNDGFSLMQCPQNKTLSKIIPFILDNYSFGNHSGLEMIIYVTSDIDVSEIKVYANGNSLGWLYTPENNYEGITRAVIPNNYLFIGKNSIKFENPLDSSGCGIVIGSLKIKPKARETDEDYRIIMAEENFQMGNCSLRDDNIFTYSADFLLGADDFQIITGIDIVLNLEHLFPKELNIIVNSEDMGYIEAGNQGSGNSIIYVPKKYLIVGTNTFLLRMNPDMQKDHCVYIDNIRISLSSKNESADNSIGIEQEDTGRMFHADKIYVTDCDLDYNHTESITFSLPFEVFRDSSGVNMIIEKVENLGVHELIINVNGIDLGWISSPYNQYDGAKKIFIPDRYLTSGENTITFIRPTSAGRCGANFENLDIVPAAYGVSEYG